ncbi:zinc finger protein 385C-like isoform X2 [Rhinolophus ferrumequinum]|uniref:zinc finger protein 385C-like isoform X2 n=1 Tax=Rhinolophus ferrumequinum TaxID=59479 RepID=UPI00140FC064|nr:zinc finger protein 385C-like isoform X2 [Rhinolophus ferrumequinum]
MSAAHRAMVGNQRLRDWPKSPRPVGEKPVCTLLLQNLVPSLLIVYKPSMSWSNVFSPSVKCLGEPGTRAPPLRPNTMLPPLPAPRTELRGRPLRSGCTSARTASSPAALPPAPPPLRQHFRPGPGPSGGTSARAPSP